MPALTWQEKFNQKTLYEIGYQYLIENFHKFKESNKIRVALDVVQIFNKDGTKSSDGKQIIYVIATGRNTEELESNPKQILSPQFTAENPQLESKI